MSSACATDGSSSPIANARRLAPSLATSSSATGSVNVNVEPLPGSLSTRISRVVGAFDGAVQGIRNCLAAGVEVQINSTITKLNAHYLPDLLAGRIALLFTDLGAPESEEMSARLNGFGPTAEPLTTLISAGDNQATTGSSAGLSAFSGASSCRRRTRSGLLMKGLPNATRSARPCAMGR